MNNLIMDTSNLHNLLESTYVAHKKDIYDFAGGHLNHNNLTKPSPLQSNWSDNKWKSSKQNVGSDVIENPHEKRVVSKRNADKILVDRIGLMKHALLDFSVGTVGALPPGVLRSKRPKVKKVSRNGKTKSITTKKTPSKIKENSFNLLPTKSEMELETLVMNEIEQMCLRYGTNAELTYNQYSKESLKGNNKKGIRQLPVAPNTPNVLRSKYIVPYKNLNENIFEEELKLPEIMIPAVDENSRLPPSLISSHQMSKDFVSVKSKFITSHHAAITKKDQFRKLSDFETNILHKYETTEKHVRNGHKAVDHLEQKLIQRLLSIQSQNSSVINPNFERLQVYSEIWQDLCIDSTIFGTLLNEIKNEYDIYFSYLLDEIKASKHTDLLTCMMHMKGTEHRENEVETLQQTVRQLELQTKTALLKNSEFKMKIESETKRIEEERIQRQLEEEDNIRRMIPTRKQLKKISQKKIKSAIENEKDTTELRLRKLRGELWKKLDDVKELQNILHIEYIPKTIHRNFQHAVKDTEVEIQKLTQQNLYLGPQLSLTETHFKSEFLQLGFSDEEMERFILQLQINKN